MQRIEVELDDIEMHQLHAFARLNNVSNEVAASMLIAKKLSEAVDKALDDMLMESSDIAKRIQ